MRSRGRLHSDRTRPARLCHLLSSQAWSHRPPQPLTPETPRPCPSALRYPRQSSNSTSCFHKSRDRCLSLQGGDEWDLIFITYKRANQLFPKSVALPEWTLSCAPDVSRHSPEGTRVRQGLDVVAGQFPGSPELGPQNTVISPPPTSLTSVSRIPPPCCVLAILLESSQCLSNTLHTPIFEHLDFLVPLPWKVPLDYLRGFFPNSSQVSPQIFLPQRGFLTPTLPP